MIELSEKDLAFFSTVYGSSYECNYSRYWGVQYDITAWRMSYLSIKKYSTVLNSNLIRFSLFVVVQFLINYSKYSFLLLFVSPVEITYILWQFKISLSLRSCGLSNMSCWSCQNKLTLNIFLKCKFNETVILFYLLETLVKKLFIKAKSGQFGLFFSSKYSRFNKIDILQLLKCVSLCLLFI